MKHASTVIIVFFGILITILLCLLAKDNTRIRFMQQHEMNMSERLDNDNEFIDAVVQRDSTLINSKEYNTWVNKFN